MEVSTPELFPERICRRCKKMLPIAEFQNCTRIGRVFHGHSCKTCRVPSSVPYTTQAVNQSRARAKAAGAEHTLTVKEWGEILAKSEGKCTYCDWNVGTDKLILEHKQPISKGGASTKENVVPACQPCNERKTVLDGERWAMIKDQLNIRITVEGRRLLELLVSHFTAKASTGRTATQGEIIERAIRTLAGKEKLLGKSGTII